MLFAVSQVMIGLAGSSIGLCTLSHGQALMTEDSVWNSVGFDVRSAVIAAAVVGGVKPASFHWSIGVPTSKCRTGCSRPANRTAARRPST